MKDGRRLVIIGAGEFAEIAFEYFTQDSPYDVVAFSVDRPFLSRRELFGLPVVAFDEIESRFPPSAVDVFVAVTFTQLNRVRARLYHEAKRRGYRAATFVSPRAFVWRNVTIGDNCFIFEGNVLQYHARIGNDVIVWSGNHIGHRVVLRDHTFVTSHVVISGYCDVGECSFLGVNSTLGDGLSVGRDCVIGAGAVLLKDAEAGKVYRGNPATAGSVSSLRAFGVKEPPTTGRADV